MYILYHPGCTTQPTTAFFITPQRDLHLAALALALAWRQKNVINAWMIGVGPMDPNGLGDRLGTSWHLQRI